MLLLSVVSAFEPNLLKNSLQVALSLECLHTYSLIHDDLPAMDNSPLRRATETLHVTYNDVTAILAGDALNTHAFDLLADAALSDKTRVGLVSLLAKNGGLNGMVLGQAIDCHFENHKLTLDELVFLHQNKTGKLIAASLAMGGVICGLDDKENKKLFDFGMKIGLFFQVRDDILDVVSSEEESGKAVGIDSAKNSFVNLLGLDGARKYNTQLAKEINHDLLDFDSALQENFNELLKSYLKEI